jgi:hypothetical protein
MNDFVDYQEDTSHLYIRFFETTKKNERKSAEAGRPVHDAVDMIEIRFAGDAKTIHHAPASDKSKFVQGMGYIDYKTRFPRHWEHYQKTKTNLSDGTPLDELTFLDAARRADLKAVNIHTVEALANLADNAVKKIGIDGLKLRDMARSYLEKSDGNAPLAKLSEENEAMKGQLSALEAELARLKNEGKRETLSIPAKEKAA